MFSQKENENHHLMLLKSQSMRKLRVWNGLGTGTRSLPITSSGTGASACPTLIFLLIVMVLMMCVFIVNHLKISQISSLEDNFYILKTFCGCFLISIQKRAMLIPNPIIATTRNFICSLNDITFSIISTFAFITAPITLMKSWL